MGGQRRILIVGAGVAGPVLAVFLKRAGIECHIFEALPGISDSGGALGIAANGMAVLANAGVAELLRDVSVCSGELRFENESGGVLAVAPAVDGRRYGQTGISITRAALHRTLVEYAERQGIAVQYGKRLAGIEDRPDRPIVAVFADGSSAEGDVIVGADGIRSQVRQAVMPDAAGPAYTGMMTLSGFSPCLEQGVVARSPQPMHFVFGQKAFFGYFNTVTPEGPRTVWWSTFAAPLSAKNELKQASTAELRKRLMELHCDWAAPVPNLIGDAPELLGIAIHDVPSLPRWSAGRTILIGDAAHAVAPHSGQGASMALEDAQMLAFLLRDGFENPGEVFRKFEQLRRPRTDKVIAMGRRNAQRKEAIPRAAYWIQQQVLRVVIPLAFGRAQDRLLRYRVEDQLQQPR